MSKASRKRFVCWENSSSGKKRGGSRRRQRIFPADESPRRRILNRLDVLRESSSRVGSTQALPSIDLLGGFASGLESREHGLRVGRLATDPDGRGVEDGVRNGRGSGPRRGLPGAARRNKLAVRAIAIWVDQKGVDLWNVPDVNGRISQPVDRGHALGVKSHSLVKCPAHGLHQVRLDDVENVLLVHHPPTILPAGELRHTYLASFA